MNILKYMGDYQTGLRRRATNELTDAIFDPALKHVSNLISQSFAIMCFLGNFER